MHVVKKKALQDFWKKYPDAETPSRAWLKDAQVANWRTMFGAKRAA